MASSADVRTLRAAARGVLSAPSPRDKCRLAHEMAATWRLGTLREIGATGAPDRPARPDRPELRPPREMPRRGRAVSLRGRIALLHALAHIECNAVDLACDLIARFGVDGPSRAFFDDWVEVADDEARHFELLSERLAAFGAAYGDLPAHDGLWEAAAETAHDLLARLAVVPLVLEARALDVTPATVAQLRQIGDEATASVLETVAREEVRHVAAGRRWFDHACAVRGLSPVATYHELVRRHFRGALRPPFNVAARAEAGLPPEFYEPLARPAG
jgi:uncharacterized ferritin-like protein (DUF455 family)